LVPPGPGTTHRPRERNLTAPRSSRRAQTPDQGGLKVTIVWILIVIILVLVVIGLARRVL
jgi:hypothetical protein